MPSILTDPFVRRLAQIVLIFFLLVLVILEVVFDYCVGMRAYSSADIDWSSFLPVAFFTILKFPFQQAFTPFAVAFATVVPLTVSSTCYKIIVGPPPSATDELNHVGRAAIGVLLAGLLVGAISIILLHTAGDTVARFSNANHSDAGRTAVQGIITSIISFQAFYLAHLAGVGK